MSNNQKAVKNNPSDSKNAIRFALLRCLPKVFIIFRESPIPLHFQVFYRVLLPSNRPFSETTSG